MNLSIANIIFETRKLFLLLLTLTFLCAHTAQAQNAQMPSLQNEKAFDFLKQNGLADSLQTTVSSNSFVEQAKLLGNDGAAQDNFSFAVAISGDTAVVGAPRNSGGSGLQSRGSAYVYVRSGDTWTQQQKLAPSDGVTTDQFGYSVAINGNTIAVGRYNTTTGQNRADGKVYIFTRSGTVWTETQTLVSDDLTQGDSFGYSLAFENDTLAVGARNKQIGSTLFQGAAYIFTRPAGGGTFTQQARLTASDGGFADFFGESVALSGDTAIIGSVNDFGTTNALGKAYVFVRNGSSWSQQQILQATGGSPNDAFGVSVSVSGDYAVIGANTEPIGTSGELGAAYVFVRNGTVWTQQQRFTAQELTPRNDRFGAAVTIKGDTLAIGSPAHEIVSGIANHGAVYVYQRSGTVWGRSQKIIHNDPSPDAFGQALAFDGDSLIAGAPSKNSARGAAYIFKTIPTSGQAKLLPPEVFINPFFGMSIGLSDDTTAIGSNLGTYIYTRRGANWEFTQKLPFVSENGGATNFAPGTSITISNNTMVIAAQGARVNSVNSRGMVLIYSRNTSGVWIEQQRLLASDGTANDQFGSSVAISGNTLVIGALGDTTGSNTSQGSAYIFTFNGTAWTEQQKITASDGAANDQFGVEAAVSGDTVVIGVPAKTIGTNSSQGAAYVFTRSGSTWTQQTRLTAFDGASTNSFGGGVAIEGETVVVGAFQATVGSNGFQGAVYVYNRTGNTWNFQQKLVDPNGRAVDQFGIDVAISGERIFIGASAADYPPDWTGLGAVIVFSRSNGSWNYLGKLQPFDADHNKQMGYRIAVSGNYVAATAPSERVYGVTSAGAGYIFDLSQINFSSGTSDYDFDGDGKADFAVFRPSNANWYLSNSSNNEFSATAFGVSSDVIVPADYDGDNKTDYAVFRNGVWYLLRSTSGFSAISFGQTDDIPVPSDFDGDGKADISVFRPSNGVWYRLNSSNNQFVATAFGTNGDKPVIGDFDGDSKADIAVFRPSNGVWYRLNSSDNQFVAISFGIASDLIVPADFDGDGKTDISVFRAGIWYRLNSSNGQFAAINFGLASDKPVAADFDGDGKADIAVFRDGAWYVLQSSNGALSVGNFGTSGDLPIANAFVR